MEEEELQSQIEQLRANRGNRRTEIEEQMEEMPDGEPSKKDDGILGVFLFQSILAVAIAILYVVTMSFSPKLSASALGEVRDKSAHDFSFRDQVYETVGGLLTYLNGIKPIEGVLGGGQTSSENTVSEEDKSRDTAGTVSGGTDPQNSSTAAPADETVSEDAAPLDGQGGEYNPVSGEELPSFATFAPVIFTGRITFPIRGGSRITSPFGFRDNPITGEDDFHTAVDIAAAEGTPVLAAADGTVRISEESGSLGYHIVIDHGNGFETTYGHCQRLIARVGMRIREGEVIARVGSTGNSTGNHLHFAMKKNGLYFDPACVFDEISAASAEEGTEQAP